MSEFYPVFTALTFNGLDILTGVISAVKTKEIKSAKLRDGLFKKIGFIICYFLAWLIDTKGVYIGFNIGISILPIIILYVCTTEVVSIIENICKINQDLMPEKLLELFHIEKEK